MNKIFLFVLILVIVAIAIWLLYLKKPANIVSSCGPIKSNPSAKGCHSKSVKPKRQQDIYNLYPIPIGHRTRRQKAYRAHREKRKAQRKAVTLTAIQSQPPITTKPIYPFCLPISQIADQDSSYILQIMTTISLYDYNSKSSYSFNTILDTGSYQLVLGTDLCKGESCPIDYGLWPSKGAKKIDGRKSISYGSGNTTGENWTAPLILEGNSGVYIKFFGMETISGNGEEWPTICGLLPSFNPNIQPSFIGSVLDNMINCTRGFTIDLKNNKMVVGSIDTSGVQIPLMTLADVQSVMDISQDKKMSSLPYYIVKLSGISYIVDNNETKFSTFPSFAITDTGTTGIRFSQNVSDSFFKIRNGQSGYLKFYLDNGVVLTASLDSDESIVSELIGPLDGFPDDIMICGLITMLNTVIGYDLDNEKLYIQK